MKKVMLIISRATSLFFSACSYESPYYIDQPGHYTYATNYQKEAIGPFFENLIATFNATDISKPKSFRDGELEPPYIRDPLIVNIENLSLNLPFIILDNQLMAIKIQCRKIKQNSQMDEYVSEEDWLKLRSLIISFGEISPTTMIENINDFLYPTAP